MNKAAIGIVEKMERTEFEPGSSRAPYQRLINPDGPEAAAIIMEMVEALERVRGTLAGNKLALTHIDAVNLLDTLITKVSGK